MDLSPLQKLDKVLYILANHKDNIARMNQILLVAKDEISYADFRLVTDKLIKDNYIERPYDFSNPMVDTIYSLTFEGLVYYEKGGYIYDFEKEKSKALKDNIYIWAVGTGTSLAGVYGLFEMARWIFHHFNWHLPF